MNNRDAENLVLFHRAKAVHAVMTNVERKGTREWSYRDLENIARMGEFLAMLDAAWPFMAFPVSAAAVESRDPDAVVGSIVKAFREGREKKVDGDDNGTLPKSDALRAGIERIKKRIAEFEEGRRTAAHRIEHEVSVARYRNAGAAAATAAEMDAEIAGLVFALKALGVGDT